jgi:hypothetical protein
VGDPFTEVLTASRLAEIAFESARYDELLDAMERSESVLAGLVGVGRSHLEVRVLRNKAELAMLRGEVANSESLLETMMEVADKLGLTRQAIAGYMGSITKVRAAQGRATEMIPLWRELSAGFGDTFLPGLAVLLDEAGERDEAVRIFRQFADTGFTSVTHDLTWLHNLAFLAVGCRSVGTVADAAVLESMLSPHAELVAYGGAGCYGSVAHFLGLLATMQVELERADWWFDKAVQINASMHAPLLQAATLIARADLLDRRGHGSDSDRSAQLRGEAHDVATRLGAAGIAARTGVDVVSTA